MAKRLLLLFLSIMFVFTARVIAVNGKTIIPVSSEVYGYIDSLYMEAGKIPPHSAKPWTVDEMRTTAERLDRSVLSDSGRRVLNRLVDELDGDTPVFEEGPFSFDSEPSLTIEGFVHQVISETTDSLPEAYEWVHGYEERSPFLEIPLVFWYGDTLYMTSTIVAKEEHRTVTSPTTPEVAANYFNILVDDPSIRLDLNFPFQAVLSTGGEWWNLLFGRDTVSWGSGVSGNLMLSDYSDFYDFVQLAFYSPSFRFTSIYISGDGFLPGGADTIGGVSGFIGHRLEMRFFDRVGITINESMSFSKLPPDLIRDLN